MTHAPDAIRHARSVVADPATCDDELELRDWAWNVLRGRAMPTRDAEPTLAELLDASKADRLARIHARAAEHGINVTKALSGRDGAA